MKDNTYRGNPCKRGGHTLRYKSTRGCVECQVVLSKEYDSSHKDLRREQNRRWCGIPEATRPVPDRCELCGGPPTGHGVLHADHDHLTNKFRGWLCSLCNGGLGMLGDNTEGLKRALLYLENSI